MAFRIQRNDITKVHADAIVNTANPMPVVGTGTDSAVYTAAGVQLLLAERKKIGILERGECAITPSFNLSSAGIRYIIHTAGIHWKGGQYGETDIMRKCYKNSMNLAKQYNCKSLAIPLLATGNYEFPKETALNIALDEISRFLFENEMDITLVVYDKESFQVSSKLFQNVQSFINENYIEEKEEIIRGYAISYEQSEGSVPEIIPIRNLSVQDYILNNATCLNFQELLRKYIYEKGLDNPTVYKRTIIIDKKLFSKIINGHIPGKHAVMALGLALELNLEDFQTFLATANYALNPSDKFDTVIKYCIINKEYDVMKIDSLLFQLDLPCFND